MSKLGAVEPRRFHRPHLERGPSLAEKLSSEVQRLSYGTVLHKLQLRERFPSKLLIAPTDPVPGDADAGAALLHGKFGFEGHVVPLVGFDWRAAFPAGFRQHAESFDWLRDLAATHSPRAPAIAQRLTAGWLAANANYNPLGWAPDRIGRRLLNWLFHAPLAMGGDDLVHRSAVLTAMSRGCRHLDRAAALAAEGLPRIHAAAGVIAAGLALPGGDGRAAAGEAALDSALGEFVGPDGGVSSRAPADQLELIELLQRLQALYGARGRAAPLRQRQALGALAPALAGMVLGDGRLASFHGSSGACAARVARAIEAAAPASQPAPEPCFQRLAARGTVIVFDAGPPAEQRFSQGCHASTFAFELSDGADRLIVNCGGTRGASGDLGAMLRTTAAHSTLVVADSNSTRLREDGCLGRGVSEVTARREDNEEGHFVEATHDGYVRRFGAAHSRRLFLAADGASLRGEDLLVAVRRHVSPISFAIRFHLDPLVEIADGDGELLLTTPAGARWRFRAKDIAAAVESSLVVGADGRVQRSRQLVLEGRAPASVAWSFRKLR